MTECIDINCHTHGTLRVRGRRTEGKVVSSKAKLTVVVERSTTKFLPKYKRWARGHSRILAHNPLCVNATVGDTVKIGETRKISKRKAWTVTEIVKKGSGA